MIAVVPGKEDPAEIERVLEAAEAIREGGRYLSVLNWLSEYGLSLETYGRDRLFVRPSCA